MAYLPNATYSMNQGPACTPQNPNGFSPNPGMWGAAQMGSQPNVPFAGRFIDALTDIRPNEVPTDGRPALFPNNDLSEIYLKSWGADGLIRTFRYTLDTSTDLNSQPIQQTSADSYQQLASRLDQLEELVRNNAKPRGNSTNKGEAK